MIPVETLKTTELLTLLEETQRPLHVVAIDGQKILFAFNRNIGYIANDHLILKEEFQPGGSAHTSILDEMIKIVKGIYKIDGVTTQQNIDENVSMMKELQEIYQLIKAETDPIRANALAERAEDLAVKLQSEDSNKLNDQIQDKLLNISSRENSALASAAVSDPTTTNSNNSPNASRLVVEYITAIASTLNGLATSGTIKFDQAEVDQRISRIIDKVSKMDQVQSSHYYNLVVNKIMVNGVKELLSDEGFDLDNSAEGKKNAPKVAAPKKAEKVVKTPPVAPKTKAKSKVKPTPKKQSTKKGKKK